VTRTAQLRQWVQDGIDAGFCSMTWCETHHAPMLVELLTDSELVRGGDDCVHVLRLYENAND